jgi:Ion transport protein
MKKLVHALLSSLPTMLDVFILFSFFLMMFGTMATQLFGGTLENRCVEKGKRDPDTGRFVKAYDAFGNDIFCSADLACDDKYDCEYWGNPDFGVTSFDNILKSVLNVFIVITMEGWTAVMYKIRHSTGTYAYDIFFHFTVIIGSYFILNLMVAVQYSYLAQSFQEPKIEEEKPEQPKIS